MKERKKRNRKWIWIIIELALVGVLVSQLYQIGKYLIDTKNSRDTYRKIDEMVKSDPAPPADSVQDEATPKIKPIEDPKTRAKRILGMLRELNEDTVGYIDIDMLDIHYPIVQGADNDEYLFRSFEGEYSVAGTVYMDYANKPDFSDQNTVLYGHHMKDGSMFHNLSGLRKEDYEGKKVTIEILREGTVETYLVYAVSSVSEYMPYRNANFSDAEAWQLFLRNTLEGSETDFGVDPTHASRVLTLSTCTPNEEGYRIAVHAILQNE